MSSDVQGLPAAYPGRFVSSLPFVIGDPTHFLPRELWTHLSRELWTHPPRYRVEYQERHWWWGWRHKSTHLISEDELKKIVAEKKFYRSTDV